MTNLSDTLSFYSQSPFGESSGLLNLSIFCEAEASGQGLSNNSIPLFVSSQQEFSSSIPLSTRGYKENVWSVLGTRWSYLDFDYSKIQKPSGSWFEGSVNINSRLPSSGFYESYMPLAISGVSKKSILNYLPAFVASEIVGSGNNSLNLFTLNNPDQSGLLSMSIPNVYSSSNNSIGLVTLGQYSMASGSLNLVATGVGFTQGSLNLFGFGKA